MRKPQPGLEGATDDAAHHGGGAMVVVGQSTEARWGTDPVPQTAIADTGPKPKLFGPADVELLVDVGFCLDKQGHQLRRVLTLC